MSVAVLGRRGMAWRRGCQSLALMLSPYAVQDPVEGRHDKAF